MNDLPRLAFAIERLSEIGLDSTQIALDTGVARRQVICLLKPLVTFLKHSLFGQCNSATHVGHGAKDYSLIGCQRKPTHLHVFFPRKAPVNFVRHRLLRSQKDPSSPGGQRAGVEGI